MSKKDCLKSDTHDTSPPDVSEKVDDPLNPPLSERSLGVANSKRATSTDVAKLAGVSQATVSRAFSPKGNLRAKNRKSVFAAAQALGYRPNAIARSLVSSKSNLIGIIKGVTINPVFSQMLTYFTHQLQDMGKQVLYFEAQTHNIDDVLWNVLQYQVEGIVLLYANLSSDITLSCQQRNIPVVQMLRYSTNTRANIVIANNHKASDAAVRHLVDAGYRHFAYITGELNSSTNMERQLGMIESLSSLGFPPPTVIEGDYTYNSGRRAMRLIAERCQLPCGVLCATDLMALGAIDALRYDLSLRLGEDVGIIGFDDIFMSDWPSYSLTSLRSPIADMVRGGLDMLYRNIVDKSLQPMISKYDCVLIERASTQRLA